MDNYEQLGRGQEGCVAGFEKDHIHQGMTVVWRVTAKRILESRLEIYCVILAIQNFYGIMESCK